MPTQVERIMQKVMKKSTDIITNPESAKEKIESLEEMLEKHRKKAITEKLKEETPSYFKKESSALKGSLIGGALGGVGGYLAGDSDHKLQSTLMGAGSGALLGGSAGHFMSGGGAGRKGMSQASAQRKQTAQKVDAADWRGAKPSEPAVSPASAAPNAGKVYSEEQIGGGVRILKQVGDEEMAKAKIPPIVPPAPPPKPAAKPPAQAPAGTVASAQPPADPKAYLQQSAGSVAIPPNELKAELAAGAKNSPVQDPPAFNPTQKSQKNRQFNTQELQGAQVQINSHHPDSFLWSMRNQNPVRPLSEMPHIEEFLKLPPDKKEALYNAYKESSGNAAVNPRRAWDPFSFLGVSSREGMPHVTPSRVILPGDRHFEWNDANFVNDVLRSPDDFRKYLNMAASGNVTYPPVRPFKMNV